MALLLIGEPRDAEGWRREMEALVPGIDFRVWPEVGRAEDIAMVMTWKAPPGELRRYPNLGCICVLGHGVDHMLQGSELPDGVPVVRLVDESMTRQMSAYVLAAVLRHHRKMADYGRLQRARRWRELDVPDPAETRVGILGLGALGGDAARKLKALGFEVAGWSRTPKDIDGVETCAGRDALEPFLGGCDIVVCMLPLTPETRDILDAGAFRAMKKGAYLVNPARGHHVVEDDLLAALDSGQLSGACLDVFRAEPLPRGHPFWRHAKVTITPHAASLTLPRGAAPQVAENYRRVHDGRPLLNLVDRERGY